MAGQLIVSVSAISERTIGDIARVRDELHARSVPLSLLTSPRLKGGYRLDRDAATVDWLTAQRTAGDAIVLHGYDEAATKRRRAEFAVLPAHEANLRLMAADRVLDHLGLRTRLFAAPGWIVSPGAQKFCRATDSDYWPGSPRSPTWCATPRCTRGSWGSANNS